MVVSSLGDERMNNEQHLEEEQMSETSAHTSLVEEPQYVRCNLNSKTAQFLYFSILTPIKFDILSQSSCEKNYS